MHTPGSILSILLESIMVGFGCIIPILALIRTSNIKKLAVKDLFILTAIQMVRIAGIIYFLQLLLEAYVFDLQKEGIIDILADRGKKLRDSYFVFVWYKPMMILLLTQLFWIKKLYMKKAALITLSLLLLVLPSQQFLVFITSFHRDYLPSSWSLSLGITITQILLNIIVFTFIAFIIILAGGKLKKIL